MTEIQKQIKKEALAILKPQYSGHTITCTVQTIEEKDRVRYYIDGLIQKHNSWETPPLYYSASGEYKDGQQYKFKYRKERY